jgi:hypothetical protein
VTTSALKGLAFDPLSLTRSYLIDAVWSTAFGRPFYSQTAYSLLPQATAKEFVADPGDHDAVKKLKGFGVPVVLVHLPNKAEIGLGRPFSRTRRGVDLGPAGEGSRHTDRHSGGAGEPAGPAADHRPATVNAHPNLDGIRFYGEYVTTVIEPRVKRR